jgi:putative chitinase
MVPKMITQTILRKLCPQSKTSIIKDVADYFVDYAPKYGVISDLRVCHFMAQAGHETDNFQTLEEYASGSGYEGRSDLGNVYQGDGVRYKGRGIFQLTGRSNYITFGNLIGVDLVNNPEMAEDPKISVQTALEYWKNRDLNKWADRDDIETITKRINGGLNGYPHRKELYARMKVLILEPAAMAWGDKGDEVMELQKRLKTIGYLLGTDGDFGPGTESVVKRFQAAKFLPMTGIVDSKTMELIYG